MYVYSSEIYFCGSLCPLIFYWRSKNLCWIFNGICYLHTAGQEGAILVTHYMAVFPLTLDLGELDKNGRAEVSFLVTIREVIF